MKSQATAKFWKFYARLPNQMQRRAREAHEVWRDNPAHPSLHFKRVDDNEPIYSVLISDDYRVLGLLEGETVIWF